MDKKIGVLITHGTDTMAWTHSYLKYAIKKLPFNIAITGAQLPISPAYPYSDGYENINAALQFLIKIKDPTIFSVFNVGEVAYSDSMVKIRKWHNDAFFGDKMLKRQWNDIVDNWQNVPIQHQKNVLDHLFVVTTGGTISAEKNEDGVLKPQRDNVNGFISQYLGEYFTTKTKIGVFSKDSSDVMVDDQKEIVEQMKETINSSLNGDYIQTDTKFSRNVKIFYTDPFMDFELFKKEARRYDGIILAGYGGGNINLDLTDTIKELTEAGMIVVLGSQVPIGTADTVYENGYEAVKAGAISAVDFSLSESMVRLSYLLGHKSEIKETKKLKNIILKTLFLSGAKFRNPESKLKHDKLTKIPIFEEDLLYNLFFEESLKKMEKNKK